MSKGWTEERRRVQAERCRKNKPWEKSTGPKTEAGKARSSLNAFKHGGDMGFRMACRGMIKHNKAFIELAILAEQIKLNKNVEKQRRMGVRTEQNPQNEVKN